MRYGTPESAALNDLVTEFYLKYEAWQIALMFEVSHGIEVKPYAIHKRAARMGITKYNKDDYYR
jgi:hypothetical protein